MTRITSLYCSHTSSMFFFAFKTASLASELQVSMGPSPHLLFFCIHNSVIMTRINSLYGSQTSPVIVCLQNNEINIRITSLYGSQPSSVVFACKIATLWPELQVSMGPSPHMWFLNSKQRLKDKNCKSQWVPALIWGFSRQNSDFWIRITILYGSQITPVVL